MEYSTNMPNFIRDIRKEFSDLPQDRAKPKLPFSIGASGMGGYTDPPNLLGKYVIPAQVGRCHIMMSRVFMISIRSAHDETVYISASAADRSFVFNRWC